MMLARNRRFAAVAVLLFLLAAGRLAAQAGTAPLVAAPESVEPGSPVSVAVQVPAGIDTVTGELIREDGPTVVTNRGFGVDLSADSPVAVVILGIPTTVQAGRYLLKVSGRDKLGRTFSEARPMAVVSRVFRRENLHLSSGLSDLRRLSNARSRAEARQLQDILSSFDPTSVFQTSRFIAPLAHWRQTSGFGDRREYEYSDGTLSGTIHAGIDMAAPDGAAVSAAGAGRVVFAGSWLITGNTVVLEHLPGVYSLYFHLRALLVKSGEIVTQGQRIGEVGSTGLATGPHLHWEVRIGGVAVDPRSLLKAGLVDVVKFQHTIDTVNGNDSEGG